MSKTGLIKLQSLLKMAPQEEDIPTDSIFAARKLMAMISLQALVDLKFCRGKPKKLDEYNACADFFEWLSKHELSHAQRGACQKAREIMKP